MSCSCSSSRHRRSGHRAPPGMCQARHTLGVVRLTRKTRAEPSHSVTQTQRLCQLIMCQHDHPARSGQTFDCRRPPHTRQDQGATRREIRPQPRTHAQERMQVSLNEVDEMRMGTPAPIGHEHITWVPGWMDRLHLSEIVGEKGSDHPLQEQSCAGMEQPQQSRHAVYPIARHPVRRASHCRRAAHSPEKSRRMVAMRGTMGSPPVQWSVDTPIPLPTENAGESQQRRKPLKQAMCVAKLNAIRPRAIIWHHFTNDWGK